MSSQAFSGSIYSQNWSHSGLETSEVTQSGPLAQFYEGEEQKQKAKSAVVAPFLWWFSFSCCAVWLIYCPCDVPRCPPTCTACGSSHLCHSARAGDDHRDLQGSLRPRAQHRRGQGHSPGEFLIKSCLLQAETGKTWKIAMPLMGNCSDKLLKTGRTSQP